MAHGFPPPFCTGKKFLQDENGKIFFVLFFGSKGTMKKSTHN